MDYLYLTDQTQEEAIRQTEATKIPQLNVTTHSGIVGVGVI